jgi:hypothetical protein
MAGLVARFVSRSAIVSRTSGLGSCASRSRSRGTARGLPRAYCASAARVGPGAASGRASGRCGSSSRLKTRGSVSYPRHSRDQVVEFPLPASTLGALRELMESMGHSSSRARDHHGPNTEDRPRPLATWRRNDRWAQGCLRALVTPRGTAWHEMERQCHEDHGLVADL